MDTATAKPTKPTLESILADVCAKHKTTRAELRGPRRTRPLVAARREFVKRALADSGRMASIVARFINRDPSTIQHLRDTNDATYSKHVLNFTKNQLRAHRAQNALYNETMRNG